MPFKKVLLENERISAGEEKRLFPGIDVSRYDRLHFHISGGVRSIRNLHARILFSTPVGSVSLLADSTIWYEDSKFEREFSHQVPSYYGGTGFVMSVPVIAPNLFDIILRNTGSDDLETVYVTVMSQEI
jgi:hypothetical protein